MIKPYFTTYPFPQWFWFDVAVYSKFSPKTGNLSTEIFSKLKGGYSSYRGSRSYKNEKEAMDDYKQATNNPI